MMYIPTYFIGLILPTISGTLLLLLLERKAPVLARVERIMLGCVVGLTLTMYCTFAVHILTKLALTLPLFLGVQCALALLLTIVCLQQHALPLLSKKIPETHHRKERPWMIVLLSTLVAWISIKAVTLGVVSLLLTPTYFDDTFSNWNLRGKVFYVDRAITFLLPGANADTSKFGVSSYPPTIPLIKVWLANLNGEWTEGVVNGVHFVWYIAALVLLYFAVRRQTTHAWALFSVYLLGCMPLYLMHGVSAYADAFLSVHIFAAVSMLFAAVHAKLPESRGSFLRIAALCMALLPFTKNEGTVVFLPPLILITALTLWWMSMHATLSSKELRRTVLWYIGAFALIAAPWLIFKWMNGLTFGNGKAIGSLAIGWQRYVLYSIFVNTFFEGNWLFLFPLFIVLLWRRFRTAFTILFIPTAYFLIIYVGQGLLYLFTSLSGEALRQTGYARGLVHVMPVTILIVTLLLYSIWPQITVAKDGKKQTEPLPVA